MFLLSRLAEPYRVALRDTLVPAILQFLTVKRPLDCDRRDFFAYAEAFASLVKLDFVSVSGAVTTITTLLQSPDTRCAAITMLGKTVELCLAQLAEKCEPAQLQALRAALANVTGKPCLCVCVWQGRLFICIHIADPFVPSLFRSARNRQEI